MELDYFLRFISFIFGAIVGSFLNVCIVRLPQGKSVVSPGSHCMKCGNPIFWTDNIPLISYFILRGKCRHCGAKFSFRYAFIEFLTACFFFVLYMFFGLGWHLVPYLVMICGLIVATFVDFELHIIPDELSFWGIPVALALVFLIPTAQPILNSTSVNTGHWVTLVFVALAVILTAIEVVVRKMTLHKDDWLFWGLIAVLVIAQGGFLQLAHLWPSLSMNFLAVANGIQGVVVGGGTLYVTGLIGSLSFQKRVVSKQDLLEVTQSSEELFAELHRSGYIDEGGTIQPKFKELSSGELFAVGGSFALKKKEIFELIKSVEDAGVMGGGDVKLLAVIGAFLGWELALLTFFIAPFFGAVVGLIQKVRTKSSAIAYGPYLALGAVVSLFWGQKIIDLVLAGYGM